MGVGVLGGTLGYDMINKCLQTLAEKSVLVEPMIFILCLQYNVFSVFFLSEG